MDKQKIFFCVFKQFNVENHIKTILAFTEKFIN